MSAGWFEPLSTPAAATDQSSNVTLVEGSSFSLSTGVGNIVPGGTFGLYVRDLRVLSQWILEVDGERLEPLSHIQSDLFQASFVTMVKPSTGATESTLVLVREREVGDGMRERITLRSFNPEATAVALELHVGVDFAGLFEVKLGRALTRHHHLQASCDATSLQFRADRSEQATTVNVVVDDDPGPAAATRRLSPGRILWNVVIPARGEWSTTLSVEPVIRGVRLAPAVHDESSTESLAASRARMWRESSPDLETPDDDLERTLRTSVADLGSLRIFDVDHPTRAIPAAGAPWFMALFGRDSLLTSWMALPLDPSLALGTVQALAEAQGEAVNPLTDEQPGRILHERRYGTSVTDVHGDGEHLYYGTADATPLFVMLVGEMLRWGIPERKLADVLPAVDRALDWVATYGDADGDGFVEYRRGTDHGLRNQGWKDSFDGINFAGGRLAEPPIALCEVQAYVYGAYLARAHIAREQGDDATRERYSDLAGALKRRFNDTYWLPERGWYAVALDGDKAPVDSLASNMGHCLWTGIVDEDKAASVVGHLMSPEMFTGWGVRTLATTMGAYNPLGYHNGSVWPHDNAIIAAGMARYGFVEEAQAVAIGILDAAASFGGRLPELFCGFDRTEYAAPVPFPTSCSPQAWAAASPLMLMRSLFRLEPSVSKGQVRVAPILPARYLPMSLRNIIIGGSRVTLSTDGSTVALDGLPEGVRATEVPRAPLSSLHEH
ncbi:amylo-alpha-1,6-glucosidase [Longivirga aurantiaca]|uniref:Glycogen debranching N-terminal domain-containing protein n=1 Tax=Longivirga aurantiaca TaxID=1837743 RepID=A0ABW1T2D6_9ACTN